MSLMDRLFELSYKHKLSHLGSCMTALPIINHIISRKNHDEKFVLSQGHAGLALYVVLESFYKVDAEHLLESCGIHPNRLASRYIDCSTGSLGQGLPIAVGMAIADTKRNVYCLISDGECAEGSIWESLRIIDDLKLTNLKLYVNANGYSALAKVDALKLKKRIKSFCKNVEFVFTNSDLPFCEGLESHYHVMTEGDYAQLK